MEYEYCVMHPDYPDEPHRGPWPEQKCLEWIKSGEDMGVPTGYFYLAMRLIGPWRKAF